jgi:hypothetical protein
MVRHIRLCDYGLSKLHIFTKEIVKRCVRESVIARGEKSASSTAQGGIITPRGVGRKRLGANGRVTVANGITIERYVTVGRVGAAGADRSML